MGSSLGKRQRERQKLDKAKAKGERKAARQAAQPELEDEASPRSESELIEELANLQRAFEAGQVSDDDFTTRKDELQAQFARLLR